ncbi:MAG: methyltransferase domain-containing protein [Acidobacteriota bacterium]|jgi:hypothetical protein
MAPLGPGWAEIPAELLVGVSEDLEAIDAARRLAESLERTNCLFIQGSPDEIPWRDSFFDVVYTSGKSTAEIRRVIKPEGRIQECLSGY